MNKNILEHIDKLQHLLQIEKEEDLKQYTQKMQETSYVYRRKEGVCWYPIMLTKERYDSGERLLIHIERPKEHTEQHLFQSGKLISFFCRNSNGGEESVNGVVNSVRKDEMIITLNADELPDWTNSGKLGIQLLFDENSYREMENALKTLQTTENVRTLELADIILGTSKARFNNKEKIELPELNSSQNESINQIISAQDIAIIHGPPGTGKTTTLISAIHQTLKNESQVLVCAPSNAAVDLLVEKLQEKNIEVLRIGHPARVTEHLLNTTTDARIAQHDYYKELRAVRKKTEEFFSMAGKYKRNFGKAERDQRRMMFAEARKLKKEADELLSYITSDIIGKAQAIICTMVGANNPLLRNRNFKTVFIDEAAQALEPACWIPILKAERIILAGDHCQLPPTVKSIKASKEGLFTTLFERIMETKNVDTLLTVQYRMNTNIMQFSNTWFYDGKLTSSDNNSDWKIFSDDTPITYLDTAGAGFFEKIDEETRSTYNIEEAELLFKYLESYIPSIPTGMGTTVGIVAPYRAQIEILNQKLKDSELSSKYEHLDISVNTIDSFQGQERDIICISLVRCNEKGEIGFLSDVRRMNVAMTRARKKLIAIGDSATICSDNFYNEFVQYTTNKGFYKSAFEYLY